MPNIKATIEVGYDEQNQLGDSILSQVCILYKLSKLAAGLKVLCIMLFHKWDIQSINTVTEDGIINQLTL